MVMQVPLFVVAGFLSLLGTNLFTYASIVHISDGTDPRWLIGVFYACCFVPFLLTFRWIGFLTDLVAKKPVLLGAHIGLAGALCLRLYLIAHNHTTPYCFIAPGLVFGLSFLFVPSFRYGLISECFGIQQRGQVLVLSNTASVIATSLAPLLHTAVVRSGQQVVVFQVSLGLLLVALVLYCFLQPTLKSIDIALQLERTSFSPNPWWVAYCALGICMLGPFQTMLPTLLVTKYHFTALQRDLFMSLIGIGIVLSVPLSAQGALRKGGGDFVMGLCLAITCMGVALASNPILLGIALTCCVALSGALVNRNQILLQAQAHSFHQGQLMTLLATVNMGVPAATAAVASILASWMGVPAAFLILAGLLAFGFLFVNWSRSKRLVVEAKVVA